MYSIAVVGAGQLGSRHLQGLIKLELDCRYFVVDPSPDSLKIAQNRVSEIAIQGADARVTYHTSMGELPELIDYAVIATAADVRLKVLQTLLTSRTVRKLLLEKVLFQKIGDYHLASDVLSASGTTAWVNCPRRAFPIYQTIRKFFEGQALLHFHVHGGNWGLGCNSIHFLDLLAFLTGGSPTNLSTSGLDQTPVASKRSGFYEFTGSLRGRCGTADFEITSLPQSSMQLMLMMRSENRTCFIDEANGHAFFQDGALAQPWTQQSFRNPFVSEQSTIIAYDALVNEHSPLTTFADSVTYHLPLIRALSMHTAEALGTPSDFCPIT